VLDGVLANFYSLAKRNAGNFLTERGRQTKAFIYGAFDKLQLNVTLGCSPVTLSPDVAYTSPSSLYHFYVNAIIPAVVRPVATAARARPS
jgi:hypothetical protein